MKISKASRAVKVGEDNTCEHDQNVKSNLSSNQSSQNQNQRPRSCFNTKSETFSNVNNNGRKHDIDQQNSHTLHNLDAVTSVQGLAIEIQKIKHSHLDDPVGHDNSQDKTISRKDTRSVRSNLLLKIPSEDHDSVDPPNCKFTASPILRVTHGSPSRGRFDVPKSGIDEATVQKFEDGFQLDLQIAEEDVKKSYSVSSSGTFDAISFRVRQDGLICSPSDLRGRTRIDRGLSARESHTSTHTIRKQFLKLSVLGRGASGVVHKAIHLPSLMLVAIKDIPVYECAKRHQLIAEIKTLYDNLSTLSDDNTTKALRTLAPCPEILCLYDAYMNPNEGYVSIVVEYMDGGSLQDIVDSGGCNSELVLANIARCVLKGLSYLHNKHQLHRDIKPSNLLINHFGEVKISDFGIAREMEDSMAKATTFVGTLTYMSPERIASEEYSYKSDVWSLGLSILTCALGKFPYSSKNGYWELLHKIRNEPPPMLPKDSFSNTFRDFMAKCLAKNEAERWTVQQLLLHPFVRQSSRKNHCSTANPAEYRHILRRAEAQQTRPEIVDRDQIDMLAETVVASYRKAAKKLIDAKRLHPQETVAWVEGLPAMQKPYAFFSSLNLSAGRRKYCPCRKLDRLAYQVGASEQYVTQTFHTRMKNMLYSLRHSSTDECGRDKIVSSDFDAFEC